NKEIPRRLQWLIKKCLRKKQTRRYGSVLEVQKKLGRHLWGKTTKASSLLRISDYLVSRNMFEAAPEQETVLAPARVGGTGWRNGMLIAVSLTVLMAIGVVAYYYWSTAVPPIGHPGVVLPSRQPHVKTEATMTTRNDHDAIMSSPAGTTQPATASYSTITETLEKKAR